MRVAYLTDFGPRMVVDPARGRLAVAFGAEDPTDSSISLCSSTKTSTRSSSRYETVVAGGVRCAKPHASESGCGRLFVP